MKLCHFPPQSADPVASAVWQGIWSGLWAQVPAAWLQPTHHLSWCALITLCLNLKSELTSIGTACLAADIEVGQEGIKQARLDLALRTFSKALGIEVSACCAAGDAKSTCNLQNVMPLPTQ